MHIHTGPHTHILTPSLTQTIHTHTHTHILTPSLTQYTLIHKYTPHTLKTVHLKHTQIHTLVFILAHSTHSCILPCTHVCTLGHTCMPTPHMHSLSTLTNLICTDSHIPPWSTRLPVAAELCPAPPCLPGRRSLNPEI